MKPDHTYQDRTSRYEKGEPTINADLATEPLARLFDRYLIVPYLLRQSSAVLWQYKLEEIRAG